MDRYKTYLLAGASVLALGLAAGTAEASQFYIQCPEDPDPNPGPAGAVEGDLDGDGIYNNDYACMHIVGTDGYNKMADGTRVYTFGFEQVTPTTAAQGEVPREITGEPPAASMAEMQLGANQPGPTLVQREGQRWHLSLSNFPFTPRPDLFDSHTVHYHGFPNANNYFDGVPEMSLAPNPLSTFTYFYNLVEPGTYFYHCHVEATEHMQMGMFGNLWVQPKQNVEGVPGAVPPIPPLSGRKFVYNDGDGSTEYSSAGCTGSSFNGECELPLMVVTYDQSFHDESEAVQPLNFAGMEDDYFMFNGRGYPDTVNAAVDIPNGDEDFVGRTNNGAPRTNDVASDGVSSAAQKLPSIIDIPVGETFLIRLSNLSTTDIVSIQSPSIPMRVVGTGARELADVETGYKRHYKTHTVTFGGGRAFDILLDTAGVPAGRYFLYSTNLNFLSNKDQDIGGLMTEIRVNGGV